MPLLSTSSPHLESSSNSSSERTTAGTHSFRRLARVLNRKSALAILILAVAVTGVLLARPHKTGMDAGSMSMNMEDNTAPTPVSVQPAHYGTIRSAMTYTGTVAPYLEDTIFPRVTGRIVKTLYAGDHVNAGQIVAELEQPDLIARNQQARYGALAANRDISVGTAQEDQARVGIASAQANDQQAQGAIREAEQTRRAAGSGVAQAENNLESAIQERETGAADVTAAQEAVGESQARLQSADADAAYWEQELKREAFLLKRGAVSLDEYQSEQAKSKAAQAAVSQARAELRRVAAGVSSAQSKYVQSGSRVGAAQAEVQQASANQNAQAAKVSEVQAAALAARINITNAVRGANVSRQQVTKSMALADQARATQSESQVTLGYLTIRASESGVVTRRLSDPGVVVSPGMGILKIAQIDRVRLQANISAVDREKVQVGMPVTAQITGMPTPLHARVTRVFPSAADTTRTFVVEAVISNPGQRLLPGQFVTMTLEGQVSRRTLLVPLTSIVSQTQQNGAGSGVWTVMDGKAHMAAVTTGVTNGADQEIVSGLKDGDLVITSGSEDLSEGTPLTYKGMPEGAGSMGPTMPMGAAADTSVKQPAANSGMQDQMAHGTMNGGNAEKSKPRSTQVPSLSRIVDGVTVGLSFDPDPPHAGKNRLRITLASSDSSPITGAVVRAKADMTGMPALGFSNVAKDNGDGSYLLPLDISMPGDWNITISIGVPGQPTRSALFPVTAR